MTDFGKLENVARWVCDGASVERAAAFEGVKVWEANKFLSIPAIRVWVQRARVAKGLEPLPYVRADDWRETIQGDYQG